MSAVNHIYDPAIEDFWDVNRKVDRLAKYVDELEQRLSSPKTVDDLQTLYTHEEVVALVMAAYAFYQSNYRDAECAKKFNLALSNFALLHSKIKYSGEYCDK